MRYFAITTNPDRRYDLAGDLTEAAARIVAETKLGLVTYQLVTHADYWASQAGRTEQGRLGREAKINEIRDHAHSLIAAIEPALVNYGELLRLIWPMLNQAGAPQAVQKMRAINLYARQQAQRPWAELQTYDPAADPNWPT